ncbi:hypothetical protein BKG57_22660 [Mycobacteroides chelonae]|nr:hypothetical protein BKG57_22660 [Mycobacteroides chelonae]
MKVAYAAPRVVQVKWSVTLAAFKALVHSCCGRLDNSVSAILSVHRWLRLRPVVVAKLDPSVGRRPFAN